MIIKYITYKTFITILLLNIFSNVCFLCVCASFLPASKVKTRFKSFRTDYVKLKKKVRDGRAKSGSSPKKLTRLMHFKLSRGKFLDAYCRQGASKDSEEMGAVSCP